MGKLRRRLGFLKPILGVVAITAFTVTSVRLISETYAISTTPYGSANYCQLESGNTVIYGWAADANATSLSDPNVTVVVGSQSKTVPTNVGNYRTAAINDHIDSSYPGDPKPGTYGFKAVFSGLYKDTSYSISGTIINVGAGSNRYLAVTTTNPIDGVNRNVFANNKVPSACLATRPVTPPPPAPAPAPAPAPKPSPAPRPPVARPAPTPVPPSSPNVPLPSSEANATVTTGTLAAHLVIPGGGAEKLKITYGTNPVLFDANTEESPTNGTDVLIALGGLKPLTTYSYQIVRTNAGGTIFAPIATFTTKGFSITVHLVDNKSQGIKGIEGKLDETDQKLTTGEDGILRFDELKSGSYNVSYVYNNKTYKQPVNADESGISAEDAVKTDVANLNYFVNLEKLTATSASPAKNGLSAWIWVLVALLILGAFIWWRRRRRLNNPYFGMDMPGMYTSGDIEVQDMPLDHAPASPVVAPTVELPPYDPNAPHPRVAEPLPRETLSEPHDLPKIKVDGKKPAEHHGFKRHKKGEQGEPAMPEHMGESLKSMVLKGMSEETKNRKNDD